MGAVAAVAIGGGGPIGGLAVAAGAAHHESVGRVGVVVEIVGVTGDAVRPHRVVALTLSLRAGVGVVAGLGVADDAHAVVLAVVHSVVIGVIPGRGMEVHREAVDLGTDECEVVTAVGIVAFGAPHPEAGLLFEKAAAGFVRVSGYGRSLRAVVAVATQSVAGC